MKFFFKIRKKNLIKKNLDAVISTNFLPPHCIEFESGLRNFIKFLISNGLLIKEKKSIKTILKNFNYFLYYNNDYISINYPNIKWAVLDIIEKKFSPIYIFYATINLIKPPFVVTSLIIPKKLRKKIKKKYLIKIVYKDESKRIRNSYKQLYYYSKKFTDNSFNVRLYKSLIFSFLEGKNSHLFKLKSSIFKKFFKF